MIELVATAEGVLMPVKVSAGARRGMIVGEQTGTLKVAVQASPSKGQANRALIEIVADQLGLRSGQVSIVSGWTSAHKKLLIAGVTADDLFRRLRPFQSSARQ